MYNSVTLIGRLGADPETKTLQSGQTVANFSLATDSSYKNKEGEKVSKTEWHKIQVWGALAGVCSQYLSKGKLVMIVGKITYRQWDNKDGVKQYTTEIVADNMKMLDSKRDGGGGSDAPPSPKDSDAPQNPIPQDDIPF